MLSNLMLFNFIDRARKRNAAKRAVSAASSSSADTPPPAYAQGSGGNGGLIMRGNVVTGNIRPLIHYRLVPKVKC